MKGRSPNPSWMFDSLRSKRKDRRPLDDYYATGRDLDLIIDEIGGGETVHVSRRGVLNADD